MERLVQQRVRNRIIETLEMFKDHSCISKFGSDEIIEMWFDWVDEDLINSWDMPVFTNNEIEELKNFHSYLEWVFKDIPSSFSASDLEKDNNWKTLVGSANNLLSVFTIRGRLSEERPIT